MEEHKKIKHPNCPKCGKPMRIIVPINMAVCDECGEKYYIERVGDEYVVIGSYYDVKAQKMKEENAEEQKTENQEQEEAIEEKEEKEEERGEEEVEQTEEEKTEEKPEDKALKEVLPPLPVTDNRYSEFKKLVQEYVVKRFWVSVAKDELKNMVSELYDAGALSPNFNPGRVAKILANSDGENIGILPFYGIEWLDKAVTQELLTRIWLKLQGYREIMKLEKLKYYIALFHPEDTEAYINGRLDEIKVKKYLYEMETIEH